MIAYVAARSHLFNPSTYSLFCAASLVFPFPSLTNKMLRSAISVTVRSSRQVARTAAFSRSFSAGVFFTKEHEYARVEGKTVVCGVSDFAQKALGDVVFVGLPDVGASFKKGESMASVESVKAASDVYAPVSGTVAEVNKGLSDNPALVNESPEDKAWFVKLTPTSEATLKEETGKMLGPDAYKKHCDESHH